MVLEPNTEEVQFQIGPYQVLKSINQGEKGDIFLVYDPVNKRKVALKRLFKTSKNTHYYKQFLNEAHLTSELSHSSIISIYSIVDEKDQVYYTMPYIEGETLKELIKSAQQREIDGLPLNAKHSVTTFVHYFLKICQAVAYAYSKEILHCDLKPSNVLIGVFGDVRVFDWGLAISTKQIKSSHKKTKTIAGTIIYLAPEVALGGSPSIQSEVYALGLILYEILTLRYPFHRENLHEYYQNMYKESLVDPVYVSVNRHIPPLLSQMAMKCLAESPEKRYQSVEEIIEALEMYLQMRPGWIQIADMETSVWDIKEEISIAGHVKSLVISQPLFTESKLEAQIQLNEDSDGIGFLLGIAAPKKENFNTCDFIWISCDDQNKSVELWHLPKLVFKNPEVSLKREVTYQFRIENTKESLCLYVNDRLLLSHAHYVPQKGTHMGLYLSSTDFIDEIKLFVDCKYFAEDPLGLGNYFLAHHQYQAALEKYKSVDTNSEIGNEASFMAGITLLEEAKNHESSKVKEALRIFEKLLATSAAPLGYLGHTLVYQWLNDLEKEMQAFTKGLTAFSHHPLIAILQQHLEDRIHETIFDAQKHGQFILIALICLPTERLLKFKNLFRSLKHRLKPLYFIEETELAEADDAYQYQSLAIHLAFLLAKPQQVDEILIALISSAYTLLPLFEQGLMALIELGFWECAREKIEMLSQQFLGVQAIAHLRWIKEAINIHRKEDIRLSFLSELPWKLSIQHLRPVFHILNELLLLRQTNVVIKTAKSLIKRHELQPEHQLKLIHLKIRAYFQDRQWDLAEELLQQHFNETHADYPFLMSCLRHMREDVPSGVSKIREEMSLWEKRQIYRDYILFFQCVQDAKKEQRYRVLERETWMGKGIF
ncbi:protein kinase domain-containing protein [Parachlamydia acanthamoebae]|uniref:protein kinase domain-containing protein n=1 Tax=Parachlamydia acanthamoebae TaxID=83552 RepID=UPI000751289E|nr:protein kinase [Parachlamydia acanthamoebae]